MFELQAMQALVTLIVGTAGFVFFLKRSSDFWKVEFEFPDGWRRHHIPFLTREEAVFVAGRFCQAGNDIKNWRVLKITARQDRRWSRARIAAFAGANQIEQAMIELRDLTQSQNEMARLRKSKQPPKDQTVDWKDI